MLFPFPTKPNQANKHIKAEKGKENKMPALLDLLSHLHHSEKKKLYLPKVLQVKSKPLCSKALLHQRQKNTRRPNHIQESHQKPS